MAQDKGSKSEAAGGRDEDPPSWLRGLEHNPFSRGSSKTFRYIIYSTNIAAGQSPARGLANWLTGDDLDLWSDLHAISSRARGSPIKPELLASTTRVADAAPELSANSRPLEAARTVDDLLVEAGSLARSRSGDEGSLPFDDAVFDNALALLGGGVGVGAPVRTELDLLRAVVNGFPSETLNRLREAGYGAEVLERAIAPRRTLARRKAEKQRLTPGESDAVWRLAHILAMARYVLNGEDAAMAWLRRPKGALGDQSPVDVLDSSVGARAAERLLRHLEWGNVA